MMALEEGHDNQSRAYQKIPDAFRKVFAAMTYMIDDAVKNLTNSLKEHSMFEDTFYIIASDNGGNPMENCGANNYPLRGYKGSV